MKTELEIFKTRWHRWLGQKCRKDKSYWTTLLNSNWLGWATRILIKNDIDADELDAGLLDSRVNVKKYFEIAIAYAEMKDLYALDALYVTDKISDR